MAGTTRQRCQHFVVVVGPRNDSDKFIRGKPKVLQDHSAHPASDLIFSDRSTRKFGSRNVDHPREHDETRQLFAG